MVILKYKSVDGAEERGFPLDRDRVTIGRAEDNVCAFDDQAASRHHAEITRTATGFLIKDLGSSNGTWVNRKRIQTHNLVDGDKIKIGGTTLVFSDTQSDEATILVDVAGVQDVETTHVQPAAPPPPPLGTAPPVVRAPSARGSVGSVAQAGESAGFGIRLLAYLIDSIILSIAVMVVMVPTSILAAVIGPKSQGAAVALSLTGGLLGIVVGIGYLLVPWARSGKTPGKKMLSLKIVREDGVEPLGYGKAALRLLGYMASGAIFYVGFIMIAFTDGHKGLHDMIAGTRVVKG